MINYTLAALLQSGMVMPNFSFSLKKVSGTKGVLQSNQENCEHQKYFWNVIVLQEKSQSGARKLNCKQERQLFSNEIVYGSYVKCTYRKIPKISPSMYKPLQNISPPKSQCKKPSIKSPLLQALPRGSCTPIERKTKKKW